MKKTVLGMVCVGLAASMLFGACGKEDTKKVKTGKNIATVESTDEPQVFTLKEAMERKGVHIWYITEPKDYVIGKDNKIERLYVVEDGEMTEYGINGKLSMGDVSKLTDEEIIKKAKEIDKANVEESIQGWIVHYQSETYKDPEIEGKKAGVIEALSSYSVQGAQPTATWKIAITTDETGNNTEEGTLYYVDRSEVGSLPSIIDDPDGCYYVDGDDGIGVYEMRVNMIYDYPVQIYDSKYTGYWEKYENHQFYDDYAIITRVEDTEKYELDTPSEEGLLVDLSDDEIDSMKEEMEEMFGEK